MRGNLQEQTTVFKPRWGATPLSSRSSLEPPPTTIKLERRAVIRACVRDFLHSFRGEWSTTPILRWVITTSHPELQDQIDNKTLSEHLKTFGVTWRKAPQMVYQCEAFVITGPTYPGDVRRALLEIMGYCVGTGVTAEQMTIYVNKLKPELHPPATLQSIGQLMTTLPLKKKLIKTKMFFCTRQYDG